MTVTSAKWLNSDNTFLDAVINGKQVSGVHVGSPYWEPVMDAVTNQGLVIDPMDTPVPPPTNDEIYDTVIQNEKVLKAVVLSLNDGTLVPGAGVSNAALKTIVKANM